MWSTWIHALDVSRTGFKCRVKFDSEQNPIIIQLDSNWTQIGVQFDSNKTHVVQLDCGVQLDSIYGISNPIGLQLEYNWSPMGVQLDSNRIPLRSFGPLAPKKTTNTQNTTNKQHNKFTALDTIEASPSIVFRFLWFCFVLTCIMFNGCYMISMIFNDFQWIPISFNDHDSCKPIFSGGFHVNQYLL